MNFLGMGPGELLLVMILALIVFGPGKLPEIAQGLGKAVREFQKATSQITEELTRELQPDTPAQETPRPQAPAPQEPSREEPAATAEPPNGPLVLEIKRPATNEASVAQQEIPATVQTAPVEPPVPVAEAPAMEAAPKPQRVRRTRKLAVEPAAEAEAAAVETPPPAKPLRRRKAAEAVVPAQNQDGREASSE